MADPFGPGIAPPGCGQFSVSGISALKRFGGGQFNNDLKNEEPKSYLGVANVKTIGVGAGFRVVPDFASLAAWVTYLQGLGTFSADQTGRILWATAANEITGADVTISNVTPGSFRLYIEAGDANGNTGGSFRNHPNKLTNALRYNANNGACFRCTSSANPDAFKINNVTNVTIRNLQLATTSTNTGTVINTNTFGYTGKSVENCILWSGQSGFNNDIVAVQETAFLNCVFLLSSGTNTTVAGVTFYSANAIAFCNNTIVNTRGISSTNGMNISGGTSGPTFRNNAFFGWNTDWVGTGTFTADHNATDKSSVSSTLPGTSNQYDVIGTTEWESVTQGSEDLRLKSTSVKCRENGSSTGAPTDDIIAQSRS